jgi:hypothetical protein
LRPAAPLTHYRSVTREPFEVGITLNLYRRFVRFLFSASNQRRIPYSQRGFAMSEMIDTFWIVRRSYGAKVEIRKTFSNEADARLAANQLAGKDGYMVELEKAVAGSPRSHIEVNNSAGSFTHAFGRN